MLNSNVKLIGTYVKGNGKESGISQNVVLKLIWHTNTEYTVTSELRKYIPYNKGIILQTSVTSLLPEQNNYVEKEELQIDAINLNGYKIEKEVKFEVGDYVVLQYSSAKEIGYDATSNNTRLKAGHIDKIANFRDGQTWSENSKIRWVGLESDPHNGVIEILLRHATQEEINNHLISIEQIQQYLPENHPDKIKPNENFQDGDWVIAIGNIREYEDPTIGKLEKFSKENYESRVSFYRETGYLSIWSNIIRHATPEEIHRHLVFTGQIPAEKYPFKKLEEDDLTWEIKTEGIRRTEPISMTNENWKPKMILSIDDEELPMVNIIKTNTIKQLLNNN